MRSFVALSLVIISTAASASAVFTSPLTKLKRTGAHLKGSPDADRARFAFFRRHGDCGTTSVPLTNLQYTQYTASVGIGSPPTYYNLVVDTGSSNTFCGAGQKYIQTNTSIPTGQAVNVTYGVGNFTGYEYLDQVTLAPNLVIRNQSIGDALSSSSFDGVDGIIGAGPVDLTNGTLPHDVDAVIPTVMNNLVTQGLVEKQVLGIYFAPATNENDTNGALTYGGVNPNLYKGELTYTPVTETYPASFYWGINITSCMYGNRTIIPESTAGIVDTGTTQLLLADDYFAEYMKEIPGATMDANNTGLLMIPPSSVRYMQPLNFTIGGRVFSLDIAAQLVPADQNTGWGGVSEKRYGVVANTGNSSGIGLDFILGLVFLERYYSVYDSDANRVGFAHTNHTFTTDHT